MLQAISCDVFIVLRIASHTGSQTATRLLADTLHIHAQHARGLERQCFRQPQQQKNKNDLVDMCAATVFWAKGYTGLLLSICVYVSGFYLSTLNINMKCFLLFFLHMPQKNR